MADQAPITPAAPAATFDVAVWLSRFESVGGSYLATESQTSFCLACEDVAPGKSPAHAMLRELTDQQRTEVVEHIRARSGLAPTLPKTDNQPDLNAIPLEKLSEAAAISAASGGSTLDASEGQTDMDMAHAFTMLRKDQRSLDWDAALAEYEAARAWSDSLPDDHAQSQAALDAYCEAMDHLIENVRAPSIEALTHKIALSQERWEAWGRPDQWLVAFQADLAALSAPVLPDSNRADWDAAMERYWAAKHIMDTTPGDAVVNDYIDAEYHALSLPAPDLRALHWKVERLHSEADHSVIDAKAFEPLLADIARLMKQPSVQANTFSPDNNDTNFWALVRQWEAVEAIPSEHGTDADIDKAGDLMSAIMACWAPDPAATKWKLDYVLADSNFADDYIVPIRAEYDHWLNMAAQSSNAGRVDLTAQPEDWDKAFAAAERAEADMRAAYDAHNVAEKAYMAALPADVAACFSGQPGNPSLSEDQQQTVHALQAAHDITSLEEAGDAAGNAFYATLEELFAVPAPDLLNVLKKMEMAHQHGEELNVFTHVMGDLHRLIGGIAVTGEHRMAA